MGWSRAVAADHLGISVRYVRYLERGQRVPSRDTAERLIGTYRLRVDVAETLRAGSMPYAGRSSPYRWGWRHGHPDPTR